MAFSSLSMDLHEGWKQSAEGSAWEDIPPELTAAWNQVSVVRQDAEQTGLQLVDMGS